ncbi:MAG: tetratricopeptide repeat protein [Candidatus Heimdallarchaeota archaeon]|nr:MAG: tetratricopeptide repeat protein [Candidatus Heimdallarchaeota archaeon]
MTQDLEEFINTRSPSEPNYSELLYLQAKFLFFAGDLEKLNDFFTLTSASQNIPGVQLFYSLGLAFQGHSKEGLEILKQIDPKLYENDLVVKLELLGVTLFIHSIRRDYFSVSELFFQISEISSQKSDIKAHTKAHLLPWAYLRQAYSIRAKGQVFKALDLINECQRDLGKYPHRFFQSMVWTLIGHCHHNLGNIEKALAFYDQAIDLALEIQSWVLLTILYNRVGMAMNVQSKPSLARKYFQKAVDQAKTAHAHWLEIGPLANLVQWRLSEGQIEEAINDYHQFVEVASGAGDEYESCYAQLALAELYRQVGDIPKSKYFLNSGFKLALKLGIFRTISDSEDEAKYN